MAMKLVLLATVKMNWWLVLRPWTTLKGYLHQNTYKIGDSGGSRISFCRGGGRGDFFDRGTERGGGQFANFQYQICLKYGHTTNVCHFRHDLSFQPHESLTNFDLTTLQPIPYSTSSQICGDLLIWLHMLVINIMSLLLMLSLGTPEYFL